MKNHVPSALPKISTKPIIIPLPDGSFQIKPGKPIAIAETVSSTVAAAMLRCSPRRIQELCTEGRLEWTRLGERGAYHITTDSIHKLITENHS